MKKYILMLIVLVSPNCFGQEKMKDSVKFIYEKYFELYRSDSIQNVKVADFNLALVSNNIEIKKIVTGRLFSSKVLYNRRKNLIINTTSFVSASNYSVNAIDLLDRTTSYLNKISDLNNPNNQDLGFSLSGEIEKILNTTVFKNGARRVNGVKKSKFMSFVNNIIKSPIVESLTNSIPVIGSIKSVVNLVLGTAVKGNDLEVGDIANLKNMLDVYIRHYEGLAKSQREFSQTLAGLKIRKEALKSLLKNFTIDRVNKLHDKQVDEELETNEIIAKYYTSQLVRGKINEILKENDSSYIKIVSDGRMNYSDSNLSQINFIRDEIESLSGQYLVLYDNYQDSIDNVLELSKSIGESASIEKIKTDLRNKLNGLILSFNTSLNLVALDETMRYLN